MPLLRHFTAFYGTACTILYRKCSITFFDFYAIYVIGLWQKIWIFVTFAKLLRGDIHKTLCNGPTDAPTHYGLGVAESETKPKDWQFEFILDYKQKTSKKSKKYIVIFFIFTIFYIK